MGIDEVAIMVDTSIDEVTIYRTADKGIEEVAIY